MTSITNPTPTAAELVARELEQNLNFRVLRKFDSASLVRPDRIPADYGVAVVLDTETTGREDSDKIIEIGLVSFAYDRATGEIFSVLDSFNQLEDPEMPIDPAATRVNGITDDMVKGQRIDDAKVQAMVEMADFVIAHNSGFDRPYCERRFPFFKGKAWACSLNQMDWAEAGISSSKLEFIAYRMGFFYEAHRAENDCMALLNALNQPLESLGGRNALSAILEAYRSESRHVWATGAPFDAKDLLKTRGYRWSDGVKPGTEKAWHRDIPADELEAEMVWLKTSAFFGRQFSVPVDHIDAFCRFTDRRGKTERVYR